MNEPIDYDDIKKKVATMTRVDLGPVISRYEKLTPGKRSKDGFLLFLRDQEVIDTKLFMELHTQDDVDMTTVDRKELALRATAHAADTVSTNISPTPQGPMPETVDDAPTEPSQPEVYEVLGMLGKGAMGEVYLARDMLLRRKVALKSILPAMQQNESLFSRFLGEMQITAQLDHPFIVPVYGVENTQNGGLGYAMKLVQGREFGVLLEETKALLDAGKPLDAEHSLEGRLEAFLKACDAIAYAHERGVVHRDLKPANIMIGRFNEVYVMDWGIARLMGKAHAKEDHGIEVYDAAGADVRQTERTRIGSTIGTPIYMSPEQAAGQNDQLDGRSDLYSLGLMLQEIVTLTGAVGGTTLEEVLTNAKGARRIPPRSPAPGVGVPQELQAIIDKATMKSPSDRYPTVTAFADDIRRYLRNEAITAKPDTRMQSAGRWVSKHRMLTITMLLSVVLVGAGATIGVLLYNRAAMKQQHTRELRLAELQASSAEEAQDLDETLDDYGSLLAKTAGAAELAVANATTEETPFHFGDDFKEGPNAVSGLVESPVYGALVSFDWPVISIPPGTSKEQVVKELGAVNSLRKLARAVMLQSLDPEYTKMSREDRDEALSETGTPIARVSLTMESGLHVEFPGTAALPRDYDGRQDPEYKAAKKAHDIVWGEERRGRDGSIVLPCSAPLRDPDGKLLGVLTFEVNPARAMAAEISSNEPTYVESSLLVDTAGKVLAQKSETKDDAEPEELDLDGVKDAISHNERGYLQTERKGHDVLVTYQPLSKVGWYVVTIANVDEMKRSDAPTGPRAGSIARTTASAKLPPIAPPHATAHPVARPTATASATASAEPSAEPSASEAPAPPSAPAAPGLTGHLSDLQKPSAAPTVTAEPPPPSAAPPPPNPFDPWKAYEKDRKPQ